MYTPDNILTTTIDKAVRWSRTQSMWPVTFGLACCAIEMMAAGSAKYDLATIEFNSELSYSVALVGNSSLVKLGDDLWVSGYAPNYSRTHILYPGKLLGYQKEKVGYELLYSNPTTPGSSGGPVLNNRGELIGINHGGYIYSEEFHEKFSEALEMICKTIKKGGCIFTCGNGGSFSDAQHFTAELVVRFNRERKP